MPLLRGQCPNFGLCSKADSSEIIPALPGADFRCPECGTTLTPVHRRRISPAMLALAGTLLLGGLAVAGWRFTAQPSRGGFPPLTSDQWIQLSKQVQSTLLDEPITFRQGQTQITEEDQFSIKENLPKLERYPRSRLVVEAHVVPSDSPEADQKLSNERAQEVKKFLTTDCGVPESRVFAKGYGSSDPPERFSNESDQEWKRRARSVRIILVGQ